jgi:hypothetical protein
MRLLPFSAVVLAAALPAQVQRVVPATLTNAPGSSYTNYPLGYTGAIRVQTLFDAAEVGAAPVVARMIEVRAEETLANVAKATIDLQIEMSATAALPLTPSTTFAANRGTNHTVVFNRKMVSVPATTPAFVGQWAGPFVLDVPFIYIPTQGNLLVEWDIASQPASAWPQDTAWTTMGPHVTLGTACSPLASTSAGGDYGGSMTFTVNGGVASASAAFFFGLTALPTPFPVPGNPSCSLYVAPLVVVPLALDASGGSSLAIGLPNDAALRGNVGHAQWAALRSGLIETSIANRAVVSGSYVIGRVFSLGSNTAVTGSAQARAGLTLRFTQ